MRKGPAKQMLSTCLSECFRDNECEDTNSGYEGTLSLRNNVALFQRWIKTDGDKRHERGKGFTREPPTKPM
ncbi:hypothetical protein KIN20_009517 [Parelaphostrongylus tenuis]|uniref:Uncharacterized protein n=1 Tax=Parelaphostrongylus tenuis TaxID=148309 RepID=A0AAD5MRW4_PARTN|nr:hypothetical protein KIN20_009517 [Parelaphostrongylus tenuis]